MEANDSLLVLVLDLNPVPWGQRKVQKKAGKREQREEGILLPHFLDQILIFINCFLALSSKNELCVITSHPVLCELIYPNARKEDPWVSLTRSVKYIAANQSDDAKDGESKITAALSRALCYINGKLKSKPGLVSALSNEDEGVQGKPKKRVLPSKEARILVVNASPDKSVKYISFMNCVFSAQKLNVSIDCCNLSRTESSFFQQSANITNGTYYLVPSKLQAALIQVLIMVFLVDKESAQHLKIPSLQSIDFRPSCFCHRQKVDVGNDRARGKKGEKEKNLDEEKAKEKEDKGKESGDKEEWKKKKGAGKWQGSPTPSPRHLKLEFLGQKVYGDGLRKSGGVSLPSLPPPPSDSDGGVPTSSSFPLSPRPVSGLSPTKEEE